MIFVFFFEAVQNVFVKIVGMFLFDFVEDIVGILEVNVLRFAGKR